MPGEEGGRGIRRGTELKGRKEGRKQGIETRLHTLLRSGNSGLWSECNRGPRVTRSFYLGNKNCKAN